MRSAKIIPICLLCVSVLVHVCVLTYLCACVSVHDFVTKRGVENPPTADYNLKS